MDPQTTPTPPPTTNAPAPPAPVAEVLQPVPDTWPGAGGVYKYSKAAVKFNLSAVVGLLVVTSLFSIIGGKNGTSSPLKLIVDIASIFISGAATYTYIASVKRTKVSFGAALDHGVRLFLKYFLTVLLLVVASVISFVLLVIPFFFVLPRVALAPYFMIDQSLSPVDALKASWEQTKGHASKVWGVFALTLAICLLVITIIGIPFALYFYAMYSAASAVLYSYIVAHPATAVAAPATPPVAPIAS